MTRRNPTMRAMRNGVTLIELLVVATIMLTLAAVSVPTIKPMMESQVSSHAAQTVSTYLERAKARAAATGRSCGVTFEYFEGTHDEDTGLGAASLVLRQVEEPPLFSGFSFGATATVSPDIDEYGHVGLLVYKDKRVNRVIDNEGTWGAYLRSDNQARIQFESIGPFYPLINVGGSYYIEKIPGIELPIYENVSYKIARDPIATMTAPVGLAQGAVVDLEYSGTDSTPFNGGRDVTVMFTPSGEVDYVLYGDEKRTPSGTIYFLIGRWDRIPAVSAFELVTTEYGQETYAEDGLWNFEDGSNFWVAINPQTGVISTAEVDQPFNVDLSDFDSRYETGAYESRTFVRFSKRNIGGR